MAKTLKFQPAGLDKLRQLLVVSSGDEVWLQRYGVRTVERLAEHRNGTAPLCYHRSTRCTDGHV